jgi:hypothetical protein
MWNRFLIRILKVEVNKGQGDRVPLPTRREILEGPDRFRKNGYFFSSAAIAKPDTDMAKATANSTESSCFLVPSKGGY